MQLLEELPGIEAGEADGYDSNGESVSERAGRSKTHPRETPLLSGGPEFTQKRPQALGGEDGGVGDE